MMMQESANALSEVLLERLQDIHGAAEPGWWPPAPGWWLLAGIALALLVYSLVLAARKLRVILRKRRLLRDLDALAEAFDPALQPADYLAALNRFFRAVALRAFPRADCARLQGEAWVAFIRERLPSADAAGLEALQTGPYRPHPEFDAARLRTQARQWVAAHG